MPMRLPPLPTLEDPDVLEKVLQGVAMLAYGILRCVLCPLECAIEPTQTCMCPTQPQCRNVKCQFVQQ